MSPDDSRVVGEPAAPLETALPAPAISDDRATASSPEHPSPPAEGGALITGDPRALRRRVLGLAWPVIGENMLETLLGIVDTLLVAALGAVAIAGVGTALQLMFLLIAALSALGVGSAVLVAQAIGAQELGRASQLARQSLVWSGIVSLPLAVLGAVFSGAFVSIMGVEADVALVATEYLQVTMATVIVLVALFIGSGALRGAGDSRTPMVVTGIANVVNVVLHMR